MASVFGDSAPAIDLKMFLFAMSFLSFALNMATNVCLTTGIPSENRGQRRESNKARMLQVLPLWRGDGEKPEGEKVFSGRQQFGLREYIGGVVSNYSRMWRK